MKRLGILVLLAVGASSAAAQHRHEAHPSREPPPELARQLDAVRTATARYRDIEAAKRDGYVRFGREGALLGEHWYRKDLTQPGTPLDLSRPGTLQYAVVDGRRVLVGVAFSVHLRPGEPLPAGFAGDADAWHQHDVVKLARAATESRPVARWFVDRWREKRLRGGEDRTMLTMVHAWVWLPNPDGPFAMHHRVIPYLKAGLPESWATLPGVDEAAARGVGLVPADGCRIALDGELWMADASRRQRRTLMEECARQAERVRLLLDARPSGAHLNAAARAAWLAVDHLRTRVLTDAQRARIAAATEHPAHPAHP